MSLRNAITRDILRRSAASQDRRGELLRTDRVPADTVSALTWPGQLKGLCRQPHRPIRRVRHRCLPPAVAAIAVSHWIEVQTGWSIKNSCAPPAASAPSRSKLAARSSPPPTHYPTTPAAPSPKSATDLNTKLSQASVSLRTPRRRENGVGSPADADPTVWIGGQAKWQHDAGTSRSRRWCRDRWRYPTANTS
jgi:hypothetical protein